MALIKINGVELKTPSVYEVGIQDISNAERNANGTMIIERIATKRTIKYGQSLLTGQEMSTILKQVSPVFFNVEYYDPEDNTFKTGIFYCGDRKVPMLSFIKGIPKYKDFAFNLIER